MILTKIERLKDKKRYDLSIDGMPALCVHEEVLIRFGLRSGDPVSQELLDELQTAEDFFLARKKAYEILARRSRSEKELRDKLRLKHFRPAIINKVVTVLVEAGLVDDKKFAQTYANHILMRKPAGKALLQRELRAKGIEGAIIRDIVEVTLDSDREEQLAFNAAQQQLQRRHAYRASASDAIRNKKLAAFLANRGFAPHTIFRVLKRLQNDSDSDLQEDTFTAQ